MPSGPHLPPLAPFLSHAAGEEGGDYAPYLPPSTPAAPTKGAEEGRGKRSRGDSAPASVNAATDRITPLPQRGRGAGGAGGPHLPPNPPSSPTLRERKGGIMPHTFPRPPAASTKGVEAGG